MLLKLLQHKIIIMIIIITIIRTATIIIVKERLLNILRPFYFKAPLETYFRLICFFKNIYIIKNLSHTK